MAARRRITGLVTSVLLLVLVGFGLLQRNAIYDWARLRNYTPPTAIAGLADDTTMTDYARHMFYVNRPLVQDKKDFNQSCPDNGGEQTMVLGCYHSRQAGIFLYTVNDSKLAGVMQVTAAHETLHAIYDRLSNQDRDYINGLLQDFYNRHLKDQRVKEVINAYKKTEPYDLVNEMHSIFGTELEQLTPQLENYYQKYFKNRHQVVGYFTKYQSTFVANRQKAADLLAQINSLGSQLSAMRGQLEATTQALDNEYQYLQNTRNSSVDIEAYNNRVGAYNTKADQYRRDSGEYNILVAQYNQLVEQYQKITTETNDLINKLDSRSVTVPGT